MATTFRPYQPYQPDQLLMLPESLQDWLPEGHLSEHVSDLVDGLDLRVFYERYEGDGRRKSPYEPRRMLKVLIYGYATGGIVTLTTQDKRIGQSISFRRTSPAGTYQMLRFGIADSFLHEVDVAGLQTDFSSRREPPGIAAPGPSI